MNTTLNLIDRLLATARTYQDLGRHREAGTLLTRLAGFRELPAAAAEETQARLAELSLKRRRYVQARRHLTAALRHQPDNARYHYLMATAWRANDLGNLERAVGHYRRSLDLQPEQVKCRVDYGLLLVRLGRVEEGLTCLRQAAEKAPDNADVMGKLVKGLRLAGRGEEARSALRAALFRNARSPRFSKLWNEFQFQQLRQEREAERREQAGLCAEDDGPVLLPFLRPVDDAPCLAATPAILRHDETGSLQPPHLPRGLRRIDQRHVQ